MTPARDATESAALNGLVRRALDQAALPDDVSAYVLALARMEYGAWNPDDDIYPASVVKVPIMAEAFRQREGGAISFEDRAPISASNQTTTAEKTPLVTGYVASVDELVRLMIERSDNVATNQLIDILRRERVTEYMRSLGLRDFLLGRKLSGSEPLIEDPEMAGRNRLCARDAARLLTLIATDQVPGAAAQRDILAACVDADKLVAGLRPGDLFMHKTGETDTVNHDAGILRTPEGARYIVVLYTRGDKSTNPRMASWMRALRSEL